MIIPMPASKAREKQPVTELANALEKILDKPCFPMLLLKKPSTVRLKDLQSKQDKAAALADSLIINDNAISNEGKWSALLVDDLYDSGASLEAACAVLRTYRKIKKFT